MKILFIGDTVGKAGCAIVHHYLKELQEELSPDLTILNCENAASGFGVTPRIADSFFEWGIDVLTSGNHIWDKKEKPQNPAPGELSPWKSGPRARGSENKIRRRSRRLEPSRARVHAGD